MRLAEGLRSILWTMKFLATKYAFILPKILSDHLSRADSMRDRLKILAPHSNPKEQFVLTLLFTTLLSPRVNTFYLEITYPIDT